MNRNIRGFFIPILILFLFPAIPLKAKNYEIENVHIFAQINKDGSVNIREERTYNFHGSFSWANYILSKKKISGVENFTVSENGKFYDLRRWRRRWWRLWRRSRVRVKGKRS
jgi:hypothetical protein